MSRKENARFYADIAYSLLETAEKGLEEAKEKKGLEVVSKLSMACEHAFHSYVWLREY
jgi:6,7-dimethyl-8-ribityllumazine synthase